MSEETVEQVNAGETSSEVSTARRVVWLFAALAIIMAIVAIIPRLFGFGLDPVAASMPRDTILYMEINGLNLLNQDSLRIAEAFQDALADADIEIDTEDPQRLLEDLDARLLEETGLTVQDNILPWIGPEVGVGFTSFGSLDFFGPPDPPQFLVAISVRDKAAADQFVQDLLISVGEEDGRPFTESIYEDVTIYTQLDSFNEEEEVAMARVGEAFLIGSSTGMVQGGIDAQDGENLASNEQYKAVSDVLHPDRFLTLFLPGNFYEELASSLPQDDALFDLQSSLQQLQVDGIGMSMASTPFGIQIDTKAIYVELPEAQRAYLEAQDGVISSANLLPEETLMVISGDRLDLNWKSMLESLAGDETAVEDLEEAMALFALQFGFNPVSDLIPIMDGEFAIALTESSEGLLAAQAGMNMGMAMLFETSDPESMGIILSQLNGSVEQILGLPPEVVNLSGTEVYTIVDPFLLGELLAYGVSDTHLLLATSQSSLEGLLSEELSLADSENYQLVWNAFSDDVTPVMYLNFSRILNMVVGFDPTVAEEAEMLNPVTAVAAGTQLDGEVFGTTIIIFIP